MPRRRVVTSSQAVHHLLSFLLLQLLPTSFCFPFSVLPPSWSHRLPPCLALSLVASATFCYLSSLLFSPTFSATLPSYSFSPTACLFVGVSLMPFPHLDSLLPPPPPLLLVLLLLLLVFRSPSLPRLPLTSYLPARVSRTLPLPPCLPSNFLHNASLLLLVLHTSFSSLFACGFVVSPSPSLSVSFGSTSSFSPSTILHFSSFPSHLFLRPCPFLSTQFHDCDFAIVSNNSQVSDWVCLCLFAPRSGLVGRKFCRSPVWQTICCSRVCCSRMVGRRFRRSHIRQYAEEFIDEGW